MTDTAVRLSRSGQLTLLAGALVTLTGAAAGLPIVALWGEVMLGLVALSYPLALRIAVLVQDGELAVRCDAPTGSGGGLVAGRAFDLFLHTSSEVRLGRALVEVVHATGLRQTGPAEERGGPWQVPMVAVRVGPAAVLGVHLRVAAGLGMFVARVYRPLDVHATILPRTVGRGRRAPLLTRRVAERDAVSTVAHPMRGLGSDIRELREHSPGDPFKHIAWKATARARKLIVKEFESEVTYSVYVLLDIGPSMRAGEAGRTRLDGGIDLTFELAGSMTAGLDRFGLVTFDEEVFGLSRASAGHRMPRQIVEHLVELNAVVHESFTDLEEADLVGRVAEFMRTQDGVDLALRDFGYSSADHGIGPWDDTAVVARARSAAESIGGVARSATLGDPAKDPGQAALRSYCRLRGIELPYRTVALPGRKEVGLAHAVQKTLEDRGGPHTLVVISDLADVHDPAALLGAVRLARAHRHRVLFLCPEAASEDHGGTVDPLEAHLRQLLAGEVVVRRSHLAAALRREGIELRAVPPGGRLPRTRVRSRG